MRKKLPIPKLTPQGKALVYAIRGTLLIAAFLAVVFMLLMRCAPITEVDPPAIKIEFHETCGEKVSQVPADELKIYKLQINLQDTTRHPYQWHSGNVPSGGVKMLGLPGKYEIVAILRQATQRKVVDWINNQNITLKFEFKSARCREKGGSQ